MTLEERLVNETKVESDYSFSTVSEMNIETHFFSSLFSL